MALTPHEVMDIIDSNALTLPQKRSMLSNLERMHDYFRTDDERMRYEQIRDDIRYRLGQVKVPN